MKSNVLGVVLAAAAMYLWGMVFWGLSPLPYAAWSETAGRDDVAAGRALLGHFPHTGTYYIPGEYHGDQRRAELYEQGPVAFVHVTAAGGRPIHEPGVLVWGFLLKLAVAALMAAMLRLAALPTYPRRLVLAVLAGCTGVVLIDLGEIVWWYIPWPWMLAHAAYDLSAVVIAGLILARFVRPNA